MNGYTILRFVKRKGSTMNAIENHHKRKKDIYLSSKDIDFSKSQIDGMIASRKCLCC